MSIETINYLLAKYYESLTAKQYLYQDELKHPSMQIGGEVELQIKYKVEIEQMRNLINKLEELRESLENFGV